MTARLIYVHALAPLHPGTGQGVGVIDLPIAREKATGLPFLPGSSLKGTLRDAAAASEKHSGDVKLVFGPDTITASEHAGAAQFTDQRLLLLPIRSLRGTFAWVTSPYILRRFAREARESQSPSPPSAFPTPSEESCCVPGGSALAMKNARQEQKPYIFLEDLDLLAVESAEAQQWAKWLGEEIFPKNGATDTNAEWRTMLNAHLCMVHDDVMTFLLETATEITARVRLDDAKKTVAKGGLWYEEALPAETILAGLVLASPLTTHQATITLKDQVTRIFDLIHSLTRENGQNRLLQFGGKATVGRGLCRVQLGRKGKS